MTSRVVNRALRAAMWAFVLGSFSFPLHAQQSGFDFTFYPYDGNNQPFDGSRMAVGDTPEEACAARSSAEIINFRTGNQARDIFYIGWLSPEGQCGWRSNNCVPGQGCVVVTSGAFNPQGAFCGSFPASIRPARCFVPCPNGQALSDGSCPVSSPKNQGSPPPHCCGGNPVNTGTGNKFQRETDLAGTGAGSLSLTRTYNSGRASYFQQFGGFWLHDYAGKIMVNNAHNHVTYFRNDGKQLGFNLQSGAWTGDADIADVLTEIKDVNSNTIGWKYRIATTDSTESYDAAGHLTSIQTRSGLTQTLVYSDGTNGQTSGNGGFVLDA